MSHTNINLYWSKNDLYKTYFDDYERDNLCVSLLTFGYKIFTRAKIIKDFTLYENYVNSVGNHIDNNPHIHDMKTLTGSLSNSPQEADNLKNFVREFAFDSLLDSIKVSICFENYFKSVLLNNGFLIHVIKNNKTLFNKQKNKPIHVNELSNKGIIDNNNFISHLNDITINYSTILNNKSYNSHLSNISPELLAFIIDLNKMRNKLHLYHNEQLRVGQQIYLRWKELIKIVKCDMAIRINLYKEKWPHLNIKHMPTDC